MKTLVMWLAAALAGNAWAAMNTIVVEGNQPAGPLLILAPEHPAGALRGRNQVEVQVRGRVTAKGEFASPVFSTTPGDEAFVDEVRRVLPSWRFLPAVDPIACKPVEQEALLEVSFETKDGKPAVFVSMSGAQSRSRPMGRKLHYAVRPRIQFPRRALSAGIEGTTIALLAIDKSGEVKDVTIRASSPSDMFNEAVLTGLYSGRYQPLEAPASGRETICAELNVEFCVDGKANLPQAACDAARAAASK